MSNNVLYLNEIDKSELSSPYVFICGVRVIGGQLEVMALSDRMVLELNINGKLCCRQKNDSGEFDFLVALPSGKAVIKAMSVSEPQLLDEISVEL